MKKRLIFLVLLGCLFITGCSVDYNVEIDENLAVKEKITVTTERDSVEKYLKYQTQDEYMHGLFEYTDYYEDENAKFIDVSRTGVIGARIETKYDSIEEYLKKSQAVHELFLNQNVTSTESKTTIDLTKYVPLSSTTSTRSAIDDIDITITSKYEIKGASSCSINNGKYICKIKLKKDTNISGLRLIIDKLTTTTKSMIIYGISGIIVFVLFGGIVYLKLKKVNKI